MRTLDEIKRSLRAQGYSEEDVQGSAEFTFEHECLDARVCPNCNAPLVRRAATPEQSTLKVIMGGHKAHGQSWSYECRPACGWSLVRWEGVGGQLRCQGCGAAVPGPEYLGTTEGKDKGLCVMCQMQLLLKGFGLSHSENEHCERVAADTYCEQWRRGPSDHK